MTDPREPGSGMRDVQPVSLQGRHVRLDPLAREHLEALCQAGLDEDLWRWMPVQAGTREEMNAYIEEALEAQTQGKALPYVTVHRASGQVVGSTRFGNIEKSHRRVEIGWTWIARPWQRTAINTEAKFLMLQHAFETLGCIRVEFKTDALNERSRRAILRIGAKEEGILRAHMVCSTGRIRDTVYFSILQSEWPQVKRNLLTKLQEGASNR